MWKCNRVYTNRVESESVVFVFTESVSGAWASVYARSREVMTATGDYGEEAVAGRFDAYDIWECRDVTPADRPRLDEAFALLTETLRAHARHDRDSETEDGDSIGPLRLLLGKTLGAAAYMCALGSAALLVDDEVHDGESVGTALPRSGTDDGDPA